MHEQLTTTRTYSLFDYNLEVLKFNLIVTDYIFTKRYHRVVEQTPGLVDVASGFYFCTGPLPTVRQEPDRHKNAAHCAAASMSRDDRIGYSLYRIG